MGQIGEDFERKMDLVIYGARSFALGIYYAVKNLYPEYPIQGFLVSSKQENPSMLAGLPVREIGSFACGGNQDNIYILVGTPEDIHPEIAFKLEQYGFHHYTCMDSVRSSSLMEKYFLKTGIFPSVHSLDAPFEGDEAGLKVFMAKFHRDRSLTKSYDFPSWITFLQVGASLTEERIADLCDNTGDHISEKNVNYCELTALYWLWKNRLNEEDPAEKAAYYGLFHYRRVLDITREDLMRMKANNIDAVLPFPTLHEPDIREHHIRYVKESDWEAMKQALQESEPEYMEEFEKISGQPYLYNYNLVIAKKQVLSNYCRWLFPILQRIEELSIPKGWERSDRYLGYLGENLLTLYFRYHQKNLKLYHTGCRMLT